MQTAFFLFTMATKSNRSKKHKRTADEDATLWKQSKKNKSVAEIHESCFPRLSEHQVQCRLKKLRDDMYEDKTKPTETKTDGMCVF